MVYVLLDNRGEECGGFVGVYRTLEGAQKYVATHYPSEAKWKAWPEREREVAARLRKASL
jgi:hypothetical protein